MTGEVARRLATAALRPGLPRSSFLRKQESRVGRGRPVGLRPVLPRSSFLRKQESRMGRGRSVALRPGLPRSSFLRKQESRMGRGRSAVLRPGLPRSSFLRKQESRMCLDHPRRPSFVPFSREWRAGVCGHQATRKAHCRPCRHNGMARDKVNQAETCRLWFLARKHFQKLSRPIKPHK